MEKTKGISLIEGLALLFIALRLTGSITWNWVWVLSPLWIDLILTVTFRVVQSQSKE